MNIEEIKDRVNLTKKAFHKLGIEGRVNINVMLNDIDFLLKEIEELKNEVMEKELIIDGMKEDRRIAVEEIQEEYFISKDKIKAKIEEYKKQQKEEPDAYLCIKVLRSLLEKE